MKRIAIILSILSLTLGVNAQKLTPHVFASAGNQTITGGISFSYTIGQLITPTVGVNKMLNQGFQQFVKIYNKPQVENSPAFNIKVFPNPSSDFVYVNMQSKEEYECTVQIFDILGKTYPADLRKNKLGNGKTLQLNIARLSNGQYYVRIIPKGSNQNLLSFTIIKQ